VRIFFFCEFPFSFKALKNFPLDISSTPKEEEDSEHYRDRARERREGKLGEYEETHRILSTVMKTFAFKPSLFPFPTDLFRLAFLNLSLFKKKKMI